MSTLVTEIVFHITASDTDDSRRIIDTHNATSEEQRAIADDIFGPLDCLEFGQRQTEPIVREVISARCRLRPAQDCLHMRTLSLFR